MLVGTSLDCRSAIRGAATARSSRGRQQRRPRIAAAAAARRRRRRGTPTASCASRGATRRSRAGRRRSIARRRRSSRTTRCAAPRRLTTAAEQEGVVRRLSVFAAVGRSRRSVFQRPAPAPAVECARARARGLPRADGTRPASAMSSSTTGRSIGPRRNCRRRFWRSTAARRRWRGGAEAGAGRRRPRVALAEIMSACDS